MHKLQISLCILHLFIPQKQTMSAAVPALSRLGLSDIPQTLNLYPTPQMVSIY